MPLPPLRPLLLIALVLGLACSAAETVAQTADATYLPRSGDPRIDRQLADINAYAARYPQSFVDEVARYHSAPRAYVEAMLQQPAWRPGDIFMACALAQATAQPCRAVVREWSRDHAQGWEGVAERLRTPVGSAQYRQLRKSIAESYARWARPAVE